jgi:hypothetical protein
VVLRPAVHAEDDRSLAYYYIVQTDAVHSRPPVRKSNHISSFFPISRIRVRYASELLSIFNIISKSQHLQSANFLPPGTY